MPINSSKVPKQSATTVYPFNILWGVLACVAIMSLIIGLAPYHEGITFPPDQGATWYIWQLPDPSVWTRLAAWGGYALHQVTIWGLIYYAQSRRFKYVKGLHSVNLIALAANAGFIGLHILQTKITYDGLAQDVHIFTSLGSVLLMLVMILIMENQRRGLAFGKKLPMMEALTRGLRKYHGYYISWAIIYTFWYHPIETTLGHLMGTFYTIMIMLQGSLFLTRIHTNKWWMLTMELMVVVHGTMVAYVTHLSDDPAGGTPAQFFFGFMGIFIITQMHGLGLSKNTRWIFAAAYMAAVAVYYSFFSDSWTDIVEITLVGAIEYMAILVITVVFWLLIRGFPAIYSLAQRTEDHDRRV